ncbi:hypothetical protein JCM16161A_02170 [Vulcanisaeta sp. JCM 16161]|uniref:hypothetical protein n=1 Tax=Vulcanisaeta sp. JCM 16161 TaxID=1295372 RepID=UPI000AFC2D7B|nr:hypothetical protein [Vulcanisaeta sp. JCM 16161]
MNCELTLERARLLLRDYLERIINDDYQGAEETLEELARLLLTSQSQAQPHVMN